MREVEGPWPIALKSSETVQVGFRLRCEGIVGSEGCKDIIVVIVFHSLSTSFGCTAVVLRTDE